MPWYRISTICNVCFIGLVHTAVVRKTNALSIYAYLYLMSYFFWVQLFLIWSLNISTQIIANPSSAQWSNVIQFFRYPAALLVYFIGTYFIMSLVSILNIFVVPGKHFLPYSALVFWYITLNIIYFELGEVVDTSTSRGCWHFYITWLLNYL